MRQTDIAIVGGGLAGSTAAAMLGRAGVSAVLVDPHQIHPPEFRCEKLDGSQIASLRKTGLAPAVLPAATHDGSVWIARFGRLVDKRPGDQHGILYDTLVNTIRAAIPNNVIRVVAKATGISASPERQVVTLSNGDEIPARLVVIANGLNSGIRHKLGMGREDLSKCHSVMLGFDLVPVGRDHFAFRALTYYAERASDRAAFITLFPVGTAMRANLAVYRNMDDPWLRQFRQSPHETLLSLMPGLKQFTGECDVPGPVQIRPADLYITTGHLQPGVVLVGDAFATSCPAAGTGAGKVFTDVERLCNIHIPRWLATDGMGVEKIAAFYDDPVKKACDAQSMTKAYHLRSLSVEPGVSWQARRWARFMVRLGIGMLRQRIHAFPIRGHKAKYPRFPACVRFGPKSRHSSARRHV
jgi:2-polyprenyl-6-methoxyphenol hydroxylase-like FAD-dependent oxidoreductase